MTLDTIAALPTALDSRSCLRRSSGISGDCIDRTVVAWLPERLRQRNWTLAVFAEGVSGPLETAESVVRDPGYHSGIANSNGLSQFLRGSSGTSGDCIDSTVVCLVT